MLTSPTSKLYMESMARAVKGPKDTDPKEKPKGKPEMLTSSATVRNGKVYLGNKDGKFFEKGTKEVKKKSHTTYSIENRGQE